MGENFKANLLTVLRHAGDELMFALSAANFEDEADPRSRADELIRQALSRIKQDRRRAQARSA